jgi:undecaprenyl-phosphate 4-deoxy-4-formamido-L-arabinose transferase
MLVSVVIPCYNSQDSIGKVVDLTIAEFQKLPQYTYEFILVNDSSKDDTYGSIKALAAKYSFVRGVNLARNFGQHNALMAALNYANGDLILGMDDDLQTHPSQMHILLDKIQEGYDLVYGNYARRKNSFLKNLSSKFNRVTASILLGRPKNIVSSNYWVITKLVRDEVIKYTNYNPYIDAIFFRVTNNIADVTIEHHEREQGSSNYTFGKLVKLWMAYWNFSVVPLRISSMLGGIFSMGGFLGFVAILVRQLMAPSSQMGWASLMCAMLLFFGFVLLVLGIIGEYLGKIMLCINNTPQYIVRETVNVKGEE